ncbi:hypothetical protein VCHENC02_2169B, partial [Vibrio harveyi]
LQIIAEFLFKRRHEKEKKGQKQKAPARGEGFIDSCVARLLDACEIA